VKKETEQVEAWSCNFLFLFLFFCFASTDSGQVDVCAASALAADGAAPNWL
jgi:hypothetical protein